MEWWQFVSIGVAALAVILVIMGRDRSLIQFIGQGKQEGLAAVETAKEDARKLIGSSVDAVHERINRVRDEYVRREDFDAHERRVEKALSEMKSDIRLELRRIEDKQDGQHREIKQLISSSMGVGGRIAAERGGG